VTDQRRLRFGVLGPLLVEDDGKPVALPRSAVLRGLLGVLLAAGDDLLSADRLAHLVWPDAPDGVRPGSIHVGISRLRRWLDGLPACAAGEPVRLNRSPGGYRLQVQPAAVDLVCFRDLVARAERADDDSRCELLRTALELCRGPVLADLPGLPANDPLLRRVREDVRAAGLALAEAASAGGRGRLVVGWLEDHVRREPLDEPAHARLITVLAACNRPAEALTRYEHLRTRLAEELGVSPSDEVQRAYLDLLAGDRDGTGAGGSQVHPRPGQLPPDVADFTGRDEQLALILSICSDVDRSPTAVRIVAITGRAGVGKTALATRAGHLLSAAFPDGQLYVDLHGNEAEPADPAEVLARFLRALGMDGSAVPQRLDERAELYRGELAQRRMLVVLDNAAGEGQIRRLLPGSPSCAVLATGRRQLTGLSARCVRLDVLDHAVGLDLLRVLVGAQRVAAEPGAADEIIRLCGALPLAIRIAGGRLARLPHRSLRWLADRLADDRRRLNELRLEDLEVRASLELSYRRLSRQAALLFRCLGALQAPDVPGWVCAEMLDVAPESAEDAVDELVDTNLVDVTAPDPLGQRRYRLHDLVRIYAREQAGAPGGDEELRTALLRALTGWYVRARQADHVLGHRLPRPASSEPAATRDLDDSRVPDSGQRTDPLTWFEAERTALVAAVQQAHHEGADGLSWDLASRLTGFFENRSHNDDWHNTHRTALTAARRDGAAAGQALILHRLGELHANMDEYDEALDCFTRAQDILARVGDRLAEAHVLRSAGVAQRMVGQIDEARRSLDTALATFVEHDDRIGIAGAQHGLGAIHREQGRLDAAAASYQHALTLLEDLGDRLTEALVACSLGVVLRLAGRPAEANASLLRSLELSRSVGHRPTEAYALCYLGELRAEQGDTDVAGTLLDASRALCEETGDRFGLALAWRAIGTLHRSTGDLVAGLEDLTRAMQIWTELDLPIWRARTLETIGDIRAGQGQHEQAMADWRSALEIYRSLQAPEAAPLAQRIGPTGRVSTMRE
jgi:DNA-binding SARP family transcriptional activator/tetratricopeptide (TPR) repeat protein